MKNCLQPQTSYIKGISNGRYYKRWVHMWHAIMLKDSVDVIAWIKADSFHFN